jgi:hypothetical protein
MRNLVMAIAILGSFALSGAALAAVDESQDVPVTDQSGSIPSGTVTLKTIKGETIAHGSIHHGVVHLVVHSKKMNRDSKVVVIIYDDNTKKETRSEITLGAFFDTGLNVSTSGPANAVASPFTPMPVLPGNLHFSAVFGGTALHNISTNSSSGFFQGSSSATIGSLAGASAFMDVYKFGWGMLSMGAVYDYSSASLTWRGGCGGSPCSGGSGNLKESNLIGEAKLTFPITSDNSVNIYGGVGEAWLAPKGTPTGVGGPAFEGSQAATAYRVGWGVDHRFDQNWSGGFKVGYQHTEGTTYSTTTTERFDLGGKNEWLGAIVVTYTPPIMYLNAQ